MSGGAFTTKPLTFTGKALILNFATSAAGGIQVEIEDAAGKLIPGFSLAEATPAFGDSINRTVACKNGGDVSSLAGKVVKLHFVLNDADLYSIS
jgi:hypothetical protein